MTHKLPAIITRKQYTYVHTCLKGRSQYKTPIICGHVHKRRENPLRFLAVRPIRYDKKQGRSSSIGAKM